MHSPVFYLHDYQTRIMDWHFTVHSGALPTNSQIGCKDNQYLSHPIGNSPPDCCCFPILSIGNCLLYGKNCQARMFQTKKISIGQWLMRGGQGMQATLQIQVRVHVVGRSPAYSTSFCLSCGVIGSLHSFASPADWDSIILEFLTETKRQVGNRRTILYGLN